MLSRPACRAVPITTPVHVSLHPKPWRSFGRDSEGSTTMALSPRGAQQRVGLSVEGLSLRPRELGRGVLQLDALDARYNSIQ